jgi:hypothetical protein
VALKVTRASNGEIASSHRGNALTEPQTERTDHKFVIVLNKKIEPANALNACAHMTATHDLYRYEL